MLGLAIVMRLRFLGGEHMATVPPAAGVVLCDDHRMVAEGLRRLLGNYRVVGICNSGAELLEFLRTTVADCLLLDLSMPVRNGLDLIPDIQRLQPHLKVLIVSMHVDRILAEACLRAGAHGFIPKDAPAEELAEAIDTVLTGRCYLSPRVPTVTHRVGLMARALGCENLTPRQQQIMLLLGMGKLPLEIAHETGLSPSTITFHIHNLMRVLGVPTEGTLLRLAVLMTATVSGRESAYSR